MNYAFLIQESVASVDSLATSLEGETITFFDLMVEGGILMIPIFILFLISFYVILSDGAP